MARPLRWQVRLRNNDSCSLDDVDRDGAEVSTSRTPVRVFQDLLFDEGIWAVREAVRFEHIEELQHHLEANLPQNSEATRHRYAQSILKWFFPTGTPDSLARQVWTAYGDESLVREMLRLLYLQAEPLRRAVRWLKRCIRLQWAHWFRTVICTSWAHTKRHEAVKALLPNHIAEYRRGKVVTAKGIGIQANEVFKIASDARSSREDELARQLLEKAYDEPLFQYQEFKKDFQDADARKVLHGLFRPINSRSSADNGAGQFGAGLGLIAKSNPTDFAPQPGGALGWIQDRMRSQQDVALSDLVNELCRPPHGLTEPMVTLLALCAVRAADPPLVVTNLNPSAGFTLATGKPPAGNKLTAHQLPQVEWSGKLEKALLGARLEISTETSWNTVLPWAKVLGPT